MSREWKPGDVGVTIPLYPNETECQFMVVEREGEREFHYSDGDRVLIPPRNGGRPLVVIDPENREQVERLAGAFCHARIDHTGGGDECDPLTFSSMQDALHEFANPQPPKPEEPMGLGAVVEDAEGNRWIAHEPDGGMGANAYRWLQSGSIVGKMRCPFSDIDAVKVLSEGVR